MDTVKIEIPSLTDNIRIVESFIDNAKEKFDLNDDIYGNIMIAVTESVNNAIVHGNKTEKEKSVFLSLQFEEQLVRFVVEDEGSGFEHDSLPDPTAPENLEKPGGRGIFLMKNLCDEVKFENEGRRVTLSFYLTQ